MLGEILALTSAFMWAFATILYRRLGENISPIGINLGKGLFALLFMGLILLLPAKSEIIEGRIFIYLGISGVLGVTLGDTLFFESLMKLGPRLALILSTLIPVITVFLAILILHEKPSPLDWLGMVLTVSGVVGVLRELKPSLALNGHWRKGIQYGLLSVVCCSLSIIFSKIAVDSTSALIATFVRYAAGVGGLILWGVLSFQLKDWLTPLKSPALVKGLIFASFIGTFLGTWFCLLALKHTDAAIATVLNSTSPLFILPLSYILLKEKTTLKTIAGSTIAVTGVSLILFG